MNNITATTINGNSVIYSPEEATVLEASDAFDDTNDITATSINSGTLMGVNIVSTSAALEADEIMNTGTDTIPASSKIDANAMSLLAEQVDRINFSDLLDDSTLCTEDILNIILASLSRNTVAHEVTLNSRPFLEDLIATERLETFMTAVGALPNLTRLFVQFSLQPGDLFAFPTSALTKALAACGHRLEYLEVAWVHLSGTHEDFEELRQMLQNQCTGLVEVKFRNLCFSRHNDRCMETILASLAKLPKLKELFLLDANRILHGWTMSHIGGTRALRQLCQSTSLKTLCVMLPLSEVQIAAIAERLSNNSTLEHLALFRCTISDLGCSALADMLRINTKLQILRLDDNLIGDTGCIDLAKALHTNKTLRILDIKGNKRISETGFASLSRMLEFENYAIMGLDSDASNDVGAQIDFFIELNEQARKVFLSHCDNRDVFVVCLHSFENHLNALFYYLRANPTMCQLDT